MPASGPAAFAHAPASVVTFRVGRDGVSEVLVSATPEVASSALGNKLLDCFDGWCKLVR